MPDNKHKRGKPDRIRTAKDEDYEVSYIARKYRVTKSTVRNIIARVGNMRAKVYAELRKLVARRKRAKRKKR